MYKSNLIPVNGLFSSHGYMNITNNLYVMQLVLDDHYMRGIAQRQRLHCYKQQALIV